MSPQPKPIGAPAEVAGHSQTYIVRAAVVELTLRNPMSIVASSQEEAELAAVESIRLVGEVTVSSVFVESLEEVCTRG